MQLTCGFCLAREPIRTNTEPTHRNKMAAAVARFGENKNIWQHKRGLTKLLKATYQGSSYATVRQLTKDNFKLELNACISTHTCITEREYEHLITHDRHQTMTRNSEGLSRFTTPVNSTMFQQGIRKVSDLTRLKFVIHFQCNISADK